MTRDGASAIYRQQQVFTASPLERVILVYDAAISACAAGNLSRALEAVSLLRRSLDLEAAPELAGRLYALYQFCEQQLREQDFATPARILRELRSAWAEAGRRQREEQRLAAECPLAAAGRLSVAG